MSDASSSKVCPPINTSDNKFVLYLNSKGEPAAVLTGPTNWTSTGLCAHTDNSLIVRSPSVAQAYSDYWDRLKQDTDAARGRRSRSAGENVPYRHAAKYPKATETLKKDRESFLAFYDFPAEHWQHLRTTNAIESTFATVRHRTTRTRNCISRPTFLGLAFKLIEEAEKTWRRINGPEKIKLLLEGIAFKDGEPVQDDHTSFRASSADSDRVLELDATGHLRADLVLSTPPAPRAHAQAIIFGPGGNFIIPITGCAATTAGQLRSCNPLNPAVHQHRSSRRSAQAALLSNL
jgi:hypothetical protein